METKDNMGETNPQYKVCLIGPSKSGKTRFVNKLMGRNGRMSNGEILFNLGRGLHYEDYATTLGVALDIFHHDEYTINFWDLGSTKIGLGNGYTIGCRGILQFHDEENNPPPFDPPQNIPIIHVYPNYQNNPLQDLIDIMNE